MNVLLLPLDVLNSRGDGGGLPMEYLWESVNIIIAVLVTLIIPFSYFYYEADDEGDEVGQTGFKAVNAIKFTAAFLVAFIILLVIMYSELNQTHIPVVRNYIDLSKQCTGYPSFVSVVPQTSSSTTSIAAGAMPMSVFNRCMIWQLIQWQFAVTFPVYLLALISFIGWFFFAIFGGIGFMALPVDLVMDFVTRPTPMKPEEYAKKKVDIGNRAAKLLEVGKGLLNEVENSSAPRVNASKRQIKLNQRTENQFEQAVYLLKRESNVLFVAHKLKGGNPLWYYAELFVGLLCVGLSVSWLIHIAIFDAPTVPLNLFLNNLFIAMEDGVPGFPLFGVTTFAIYCFYLLWCVIKGAFRFGMQIPYCFKIYPMEIGNTYLNAFLANSWLIVLSSVPIVQFCVQSFPYYTRNTSADILLGTQVRWLQFFYYFWSFEVFIFLILFCAFVSMMHILSNPFNIAANIENQLKAMATKEDDGLGLD